MRILIVGNKNHQYIYNYVKHLREEFRTGEIVIDVLSIYPRSVNTDLIDNLYDRVHSFDAGFFYKVKFIGGIIANIRFRKQISKLFVNYDIVHVHYVESYIHFNMRFFLFSLKNKLIVSIWGSDWYKATNARKNNMLSLFNRADVITVEHEQEEKEIEYFYQGKLTKNKICEIRFGLEPLDALKKLKNIPKKLSKKIMGWDENRFSICIGYNTRENQQHFSIIKSFCQTKELVAIADKIELIFPFTYPSNEKYVKNIEEILNQCPFKFVLLCDFMSDEKIAHLRNASDIMLQLQVTDSFSGSMLEHMFANNIVITGSWLPYNLLRENGIYYRTVDHVDEAGFQTYSVLTKLDEEHLKCGKNQSMIEAMSMWSNVIKGWKLIYMKLIEG